MKKLVLLLSLLLAAMAHAGDPQDGDGAVKLHFQKIEKELIRQGVPEDGAKAMIQAMTRANFTEEQMVRAANQLRSGDNQEIVATAVREKINEGIAKGIPPETILQATARVRSRFEFAMNIAGQLDKKNQVQLSATVADCLRAGLTEEDARFIAAALQTRTRKHDDESSKNLRMETMYIARDLTRQGVSSATTTEVLDAALTRSYDVEAMRTLRAILRNTETENIENKTRQFASSIAHGVKAGDLQGSGNSHNGKGEASAGADNDHGHGGSDNGADGESSGGDNGGGGKGNGGGGGGRS